MALTITLRWQVSLLLSLTLVPVLGADPEAKGGEGHLHRRAPSGSTCCCSIGRALERKRAVVRWPSCC